MTVLNKGLVALNFKELASPPAADSVPTLIAANKLSVLQEGDDRPFYKIESIPYPATGNGAITANAIYEESFFQSFLNVLKDHPIPGSKSGHGWEANKNDFYLVGGRLDSNGDGTGTVHFKNYIPPMGANGSNASFIRDARVGIINFSLVTSPKIEYDESGVEHIVETNGRERNDAVGYKEGAMDQAVNADGKRIMSGSLSNLRARIRSGDVDESSPWSFTGDDGNKLLGPDGDDWTNFAKWHLVENTDAEPETKARYSYPFGKNGKVFRSALRAIASRAAQQGLDDVSSTASDMLDLMTQMHKEKGSNMDKAELLSTAKNMATNGGVTLIELAQAMGLENQLVTDKHKTALETMNSLEKMGVKDPAGELAALREQQKTAENALIESRLTKEFGPEKDGEGKENDIRVLANVLAQGVAFNALDAKVEEIKKNSVIQRLARERADYTSEVNNLGIVENGSEKKTKVLANGVEAIPDGDL